MESNKVEKSLSKPGPVILMGSGETSPASGAVFEEAAKLYGDELRIAIMETPAGFELNSKNVAGRVGDFLTNRLQNYHPHIDIIPARKKGTAFSPDDEVLLEPLYKADMIFMGPGSPTYAARQLTGSLAHDIIQARQRNGSALILSSAATIAFGCQTLPVYEIYKAGMDIHWQEGLHFFQHYGLSLIIIPHWNNAEGGAELDTSHCFMGADRFSALQRILDCQGAILGIDEHTSVWIDLDEGKARIFGKGSIHLITKDDEDNFESGTQISLKKFGQYQTLKDWRINLRQDVVKKLELSQWHDQRCSSEMPSEDIMEWLRQRDTARQSGDYTLADQIRQRIEGAGWRVTDTPSGSRIERL